MNLPTEHQEQSAFMKWLGYNYPDVRKMTIHVPNGASLTNRGNSWRRLEELGAKKGYPDILMDYPVDDFHGARIEMKRKGEKPTEDQIEWLQNLSMKGYACAICYSCDEAISFTETYLKNGKLLRRIK